MVDKECRKCGFVEGIYMNMYKLPADAFNRTHEQKTISIDAIKDKLVGKRQKEIIDVIVDKDKMIESTEQMAKAEIKAESEDV